MPHFRVLWEIDAETETPLAAAEEAFAAMQAEGTTATCFTFVDTHTGGRYTVDLRSAGGHAVVQRDNE